MANDKVCQPHEGDKGQVDGPQVPLLSHGSEIKSPNWACREYKTLKSKLIRSANLRKVTRARSVDHRCLF